MTEITRSLVEFLRRWFLADDLDRRVFAWLTVAVVLVVPLFDAPTYSLDSIYTDHRRHAYAAWAFLNIGPEVYTTAIEQWQFGALRPFISWAPIPHLYPLGSLLLFLPFGIVNNTGILPEPIVNMSMIMLLGIGSVGATWLLYRLVCESYRPVLSGLVMVLAAILYVFWGLNGFFDSIDVAAAALYGIRAYRRENDGTALLALVVALSLHYRLWYLGPMALVVFVRYAQAQHGVVDWRLAIAGVLGGGSIITFVLTIPGLMTLSTSSIRNENPLTPTTGVTPEILVVLAGSVVLLAVLYRYESDPTALAALTLAVASVFVFTQWSPWYSVLLTPALVLVEKRPSQAALVASFYWVALHLGMLSANRSFLPFLQATVGLG